jgi:hypothetical protein
MHENRSTAFSSLLWNGYVEAISHFAWNWTSDGRLFMKPVLTCSFFPGAPRDAPDIAVCQAVDSVKGENVVINTRTESVT